MPKITVLPHPEYSIAGAAFEVSVKTSICDALLNNGIDIDHACGKVGACTTCHVIVTAGLDSLNQAQDHEEDMLDMAWGLKPESRLSCQAIIGDEDITVEIPKYSINHAKENG